MDTLVWRIIVKRRLSLRSRLLKAIWPTPSTPVVNLATPTEENVSSLPTTDTCRPYGSEITTCQGALLQLPHELLLNIMLHLPHSSIYMLRQTCRLFRRLSHDRALKDFGREILRSEHESYCITEAGFEQLRTIRNILLRTHLCTGCALLADSGDLVRQMQSLWEPVYCSTCDEWHPAFFFPTNREKKASCLGVLGYFTICDHYKLSMQLKKTQRKAPFDNSHISFTCSDSEHLFSNITGSRSYSPYYCAPKFNIYSSPLSSYVHVQRDFCLLRVAYDQSTDIQTIQIQLDKQLQNCKYLCKHFADQKDSVLRCLISSRCPCFPPSGLSSCQRYVSHWCENHNYCCRHCGTSYSWIHHQDTAFNGDSYITLRVSYRWRNFDPLSFGWLANLDFKTTQHPIFNDTTKGVLWCDDPNCGTGSGFRWLRMVKMYRHKTSDVLWNDLESELFQSRSPPVDIEDIRQLSLEYETFEDKARWYPPRLFRGYRYGRPLYTVRI